MIMTKAQIAQMVSIRYQYSHYFCQLLERLLAKVPEGPIRDALQMNRSEELGTGSIYYGSAHKDGRRRLLEALGIDYASWEPKGHINHLDDNLHPAANRVINEYKKLIDRPNFLVGVAAIAISESSVPKQYGYLVSLLKEYWPELTDRDMFHLLDHIEHDVHHGTILEALLDNESDHRAIQYGKVRAARAWKEFWETLRHI